MDSNKTSKSAGDSVKGTIVASVASERDIEISTSCAGIVNSQGETVMRRSGAAALISQGDLEATQCGAVALVAGDLTGDQTYSALTVASDVNVSRSWIGVALSPRLQVSEGSRVIIGPVAALIISCAILGVFGIAAWLFAMALRRALAWRPKMPSVSWHRMGE